MPNRIDIPDINDINAAWLSVQLEKAGLVGAKVRRVSHNPVGTGQGGHVFRLSLEYDGAGQELPQTLIAKFPSSDPLARQASVAQKIYLREVQFFKTLAPQLALTRPRLPRAYYAEINGHGPEFLILLEDAAPAVQGDQTKGCSTELARLAVHGLVGLHAPSWHNASIIDLDWLADDHNSRNGFILQIYRDALPHFIDRCGEALAAEELKLVERVAQAALFPSEAPAMRPHCLVHSDYRLDNMLIDDRNTPPDVFIVDWQTMIVGNPMRDSAYFIGGCLSKEQRQPLEKDLIREYHAGLVAAGVADYAWSQCWDDYRQSTFHGLMNAVVAMLYARKTERGDALFRIMGQRHARHALDLGAAEFIQ